MTKQYAILQKKLQELESQLATIYSFPPNITVPEPLIQDSHQRLAFLRRFLAAEVASGPTKPHHLAHISRRLDHLADGLSTLPDRRQNEVEEDEDDTCSCTESCLNDDGEEGLAIVEYDEGTLSFKDDVELYSDCLGAEIVEDEKRLGLGLSEFEKMRLRRVYVYVFGLVFVVFGLVLFVLFGYESSYYDRRFQKFLIPT